MREQGPRDGVLTVGAGCDRDAAGSRVKRGIEAHLGRASIFCADRMISRSSRIEEVYFNRTNRRFLLI